MKLEKKGWVTDYTWLVNDPDPPGLANWAFKVALYIQIQIPSQHGAAHVLNDFDKLVRSISTYFESITPQPTTHTLLELLITRLLSLVSLPSFKKDCIIPSLTKTSLA